MLYLKYQFSFIDDSESDSNILDTEMGNDEQCNIDPFIKDSDSSIMTYDKKKIVSKINDKHIDIMESSNSDRLKPEESLFENTENDSTYNESIITDFNNTK